MTRRLEGATRSQWLAARTGLDAALAETVALAADDVLLDELLARLDQVPGAAGLLAGLSVYREPVDVNALLFQAGQPDPDAEHIPDRTGANQRIAAILAAAGISPDKFRGPGRCPRPCHGGARSASGRAEPAADTAVPAGTGSGAADCSVPDSQPADCQR